MRCRRCGCKRPSHSTIPAVGGTSEERSRGQRRTSELRLGRAPPPPLACINMVSGAYLLDGGESGLTTPMARSRETIDQRIIPQKQP
jgi:hypothetical protein